uniref:Putative pectate lyase n=1 Tax=viral metagenome TaxID=1070528 RepID=A0A6M3KZZ8_9ZZZZ
MASRTTPYFVHLAGGFSGMNNPGGRVYWVAATGYLAVDGVAPSDSNNGTSPQQPFATVQAALNACTAGRGDIVAVLPGTYTITTALTMTKDDVTLMSALPVGARERGGVVIVNATAATGLLTIDANNCSVIGLVFDDNVTAATADTGVILISTASTAELVTGTKIINCYLDMLGADADRDGICVGLTTDATDAAPYTLIEGCTVLDCDQDAIVVNVGSGYSVIRDCHIYDVANLTRYGVEVLATSVTVEDCDIMVGDTATPGACIHNGVAAARLLAHRNHLAAFGADTTGILVINTATQMTSGNWIVAAAAANIVDYLTASTTPSADANVQSVYGADPPTASFDTPTVAGA